MTPEAPPVITPAPGGPSPAGSLAAGTGPASSGAAVTDDLPLAQPQRLEAPSVERTVPGGAETLQSAAVPVQPEAARESEGSAASLGGAEPISPAGTSEPAGAARPPLPDRSGSGPDGRPSPVSRCQPLAGPDAIEARTPAGPATGPEALEQPLVISRSPAAPRSGLGEPLSELPPTAIVVGHHHHEPGRAGAGVASPDPAADGLQRPKRPTDPAASVSVATGPGPEPRVGQARRYPTLFSPACRCPRYPWRRSARPCPGSALPTSRRSEPSRRRAGDQPPGRRRGGRGRAGPRRRPVRCCQRDEGQPVRRLIGQQHGLDLTAVPVDRTPSGASDAQRLQARAFTSDRGVDHSVPLPAAWTAAPANRCWRTS